MTKWALWTFWKGTLILFAFLLTVIGLVYFVTGNGEVETIGEWLKLWLVLVMSIYVGALLFLRAVLPDERDHV